MARPLTVVQLVPALGTGGAERSAIEIAEALVAAGHRAIVVSAGGPWEPRLAATGASHIRIDLARKSPLAFRHVLALRRLFKEVGADIVHARSRLPAWLAWLALRGLPAPRPRFVTTVHGLNSPGRWSGIMTRGERIICVSETCRRHVLAHWPDTPAERLVVIPRGVDPAEFPAGARPTSEWRARLDADFPTLAGRSLLLLPARGTRLKNHADGIRLLARLRDAYGLDAGLLLAGVVEPSRKAYCMELEQLARETGVADRVAFSPARADMRELIGGADLVLQMSSKPESFGRTVVEALAVGTPVVGYAHGGVGELLAELQPEGAVAPGDLEGLAAAAARMIGRRHAGAIPARYTLPAMQAATLSIYESLASAARDGGRG
jgi:glycosyltransferase involved in cell wall biosynthesis